MLTVVDAGEGVIWIDVGVDFLYYLVAGIYLKYFVVGSCADDVVMEPVHIHDGLLAGNLHTKAEHPALLSYNYNLNKKTDNPG